MKMHAVLNIFRLSRKNILLFFAVMGPGLAVMLADTDAGSIIISAQSGAQFGYKLLAMQFLLIPILYIVQELTLRLGIVTKLGHGELIYKIFGKAWAWLSISTLIICCIGAIISEFIGLAGAGALFGIPHWATMAVVVLFLAVMAWTGSYKSVERVAIFLGLFELIFLYVAWKAHPNLHEMLQGMKQMPWHNNNYIFLVSSNIGAVIMPWMIFFQQSAVVDKKLSLEHLNTARMDTFIGAIVTQSIMCAVLVITATTIGKDHPGMALNTVEQISEGLTPYLGTTAGNLLFALGISGAALIAAIVVSLTAAWGLGEILGYKRSLDHKPKEAPWFYTIYSLVLIIGGLYVASGINLVNLSVGIGVMNALLLPIVLGFLFMLSVKALPENYRLKGWYAWCVGIIIAVTSGFGVVSGIIGCFQ